MDRKSMRIMKSRALVAVAVAAWVGVGCDSTKPKPAVDLIYAGGNGQSQVAGAALTTPPAAKAVDEDGAGVSGVTVTWVVAIGGGSVATSSSTTGDDEIGRAACRERV